MISRLFFIVVLSTLAFGAQMFQSVEPSKATIVGSGENKEFCLNCGMSLTKFYKTNHVHLDKQYCSLHCLYESTKGNLPQIAQVVDTKNLNLIDAYSAFYVVGSKVKGTMSVNSKYAFANEDDAREFQTQNGGTIMNFQKAFDEAKKDFINDKKMIKAKKEGGMYAKGKTAYETKCQKTNAKEFRNIAALKENLKKICDIQNDGELQAVALYLWDNPKINEQKQSSKIVVPKNAKCPVCGMYVDKHPNWAAVIEDENLYFDGVKDMMKYILKEKKAFEKVFVSDYYKLKKIDAKAAFYVIGSDVYGPMGNELIPFETKNEAITFAKDHNGKMIVTFKEIDEKLLEEL